MLQQFETIRRYQSDEKCIVTPRKEFWVYNYWEYTNRIETSKVNIGNQQPQEVCNLKTFQEFYLIGNRIFHSVISSYSTLL